MSNRILDDSNRESGDSRQGLRSRSRPHSRPRRDGDRNVQPPTGEYLVLVRFKGNRKACYHNRRGIDIAVDDYCLVEADRGRDMGRISYIGPGKGDWWREAVRQGVLEKASAGDLARLHENRGDEWEFWDICQEKIQNRRLKMSLVTVERQFDHNKITFFFTAEKRVDFRELVRDLASIFRTRIELRQIGVRDEARLKGGVGVCGREFCCSTFLHEFMPVTLKMAKEQQLPLNPSKLSGLCGRLRCCLSYEHSDYHTALQRLPCVGGRVAVDGQYGVVRKIDLIREMVTVGFGPEGESVTVGADEVEFERQPSPPAQRRRGDQRGGQRGEKCQDSRSPRRRGRRRPRSR